MNLIKSSIILAITFTYTRFTFTQDCTCDLTTNQCNLNCCCDIDCSETDKLAFSSCLPENTNRIEEICVSDSILYSSNNKYQAQGNGMGLFCVFKDNYEARHLYTNVPMVSTESAFNLLANQYKRSVYSVEDSSSVPTNADAKNSFKAGDPLFILFDSNNRRGYLPQPTVFLTNQCEDQNPARFLFANKISCQRPIPDLTNDCQNKAFLKAAKYVDGFKVATYPSFLGGNNSALVTPTLKSVMCMVDVKISPCLSNTIQNPVWNGTHCENVLLEVEYNVQYDTNTTVEITAVEVTVVVGAISSTTSLEQSFSYKFAQKNEGASNVSVTERSGNPGYITGLPIISGIIDTTTDTVNLTENATALSLIATPIDSLCSNSEMKRESLKFGLDYQSSCFYDLQSLMTTNDCDTLQQNIFNLLLPNIPNRVASFGNTLTTNTQDWVTVINTPPTVVPTATNNVCTNMITDVTYQILYAKTGYFANPQNQIVGFEVKYGTPRTFQSQCSGLLCSGVNRALISQSVSFIDVSTTPVNEVKPKPKFRSKAPNDFFYPFL